MEHRVVTIASLVLLPVAGGVLVVRRLQTNRFFRLLGASFGSWADATRNGPELARP